MPINVEEFAKDVTANIPNRNLTDASVSRWTGIDPPNLAFTFADLVPEGMVTLLVAEGGAGKSIMQQTALSCVAADQSFLGKDTVTGAAAGLFAEDPEAVLHFRQVRINHTLGTDMPALGERLFIRSYFGLESRLWIDGKPTSLLTEIEQQLARIPALRLLALDNAALLYGDNENDRPNVTAFMSSLNGMADRLKIGIILSTHQSKSRTNDALGFASGSTAWVNAARSALELRPGDDDTPPHLILRKANHTKPGGVIDLEWRGGVLVPKYSHGGMVSVIEHRIIEREFLDALDTLESQGRHASHSPNSPHYAPKVLRRDLKMKHSKKDIEIAMNNLFAAGKIVASEVRKSNRHTTTAIIKTTQNGSAPSASSTLASH